MNGSLEFVVNSRMVFVTVIPFVRCSWGPVESELALVFVAEEPPQAHVHVFDEIGYSGEVGDVNSISIVSLQGCLGLWLSYFYDSVAQGGHFLGGNK